MIDFLIFFNATILTPIIIVGYLAYLLPFRMKSKYLLIVPLLTVIFLSSAADRIPISNMVLNFFINCFAILVALIFFGNTMQGLLYVLILEAVLLLSDGFVYHIACIIWGNEYISTEISYLLTQLAVIVISTTILLFVTQKLKSVQYISVPKIYWIFLFTIPAGSIFLLFCIYGLYQSSEVVMLEPLVSIIVVFFIIISTITIYSNTIDYFRIKLHNQKLTSQFEAFAQKQKDVAAISRKMHQIQHDMKNQLFPIISALESDEYDIAKTSLKKIFNGISDNVSIIYTGNEYIDDMLNYKIGVAQKYGVNIKVENKMGISPKISFMDVSAVIGIALDNAIEACSKDVTKKDVSIFFFCWMGIFYVKIENEFLGEVKTDKQGRFLTTKENPDAHGYGLESIRKLLNINDGELNIETKNNKFVLKIILKTQEQ